MCVAANGVLISCCESTVSFGLTHNPTCVNVASAVEQLQAILISTILGRHRTGSMQGNSGGELTSKCNKTAEKEYNIQSD